MTSVWQTRKLGDLLEVQNGYAFSSKDYSETGHFVMRIGNVQNGYVALSEPKFIDLTADEKLKRFALSEGDILVSLTGNVGRVGVIQKEHLPAALNQRVARITINKGSPVTKEFLLFFLYSDWFREELMGAGHGAAQQNVSTKDLVEIQLPFPPLPEQKRIVGILDKAFASISTAKANAEKNLQNARELFESYLRNVFANPGDGWEVKKLGEVCDFFNGKAHEKCIDEKGNYIVVNSKFISSDGQICKKTKKQLFPLFHGDIVMVMSDVPNGKALMKSFLVDVDSLYTLNQRICAIRSKSFDNKFLNYQLNRNKYFLAFNNGENQTNLRKNEILNCPLLIPFLTEQRTIVAKLNAFSAETKKLEAIYQQKLADLDELKNSVLQKAFNGEL